METKREQSRRRSSVLGGSQQISAYVDGLQTDTDLDSSKAERLILSTRGFLLARLVYLTVDTGGSAYSRGELFQQHDETFALP